MGRSVQGDLLTLSALSCSSWVMDIFSRILATSMILAPLLLVAFIIGVVLEFRGMEFVLGAALFFLLISIVGVLGMIWIC